MKKNKKKTRFNAGVKDEWREFGSLNSLKSIHEFYCTEKQSISKDARNIFVKGKLSDVKREFQVNLKPIQKIYLFKIFSFKEF